MFIQREKNRLLWGATVVLGMGIILGGGAARVEGRACNTTENSPGHCLTEAPKVRVAHGMLSGAFASGGALLTIGLLDKLQKR
ncbi:hypothetical protein [Leptolyngbya sp. KIOST-1]|uniref:hypothetical protein n=1 Tax=Leptolyngbya sp. KIOST-1 TaxID=1229172 RepID=UPI00055FCDAC|nr:hypothetical protein [Leptolyngbya sp. KIOST-1]